MRIAANEVFRLAVEIREVTSPSSGNKDFLTSPLVSLQDRNFAPALTCLASAHQSGSATSQYQNFKFVNDLFCQGLLNLADVSVSGRFCWYAQG